MQEYEEKELANLIYKYKTEIMIPKTLYEKLRPEIKELINKVFFESWTDISPSDIIFSVKLVLNGIKLSDGTTKKFNYEEARDLYTDDYKIIFDEIYRIMKEEQENNSN